MLVVEKFYGLIDSVNNEKVFLFKNFFFFVDFVKDYFLKRNILVFNL